MMLLKEEKLQLKVLNNNTKIKLLNYKKVLKPKKSKFNNQKTY